MNNCTSLIFCIIGVLVCSLAVEAQKIRGTPGVDYPSYPDIPKTSFRCSEQKYIPGFYADLETECQVFHFCFESREESFLCPTGTIFNQKILSCDSWYSFNCSLAPLFYSVNAGPVAETAGKSISMLLKIKDHSRDNTRASTSNVFQKISSLYEESTEQMTLLDSNAENASSEGESDKKSAIAVDKPEFETTHEKNSLDDKGSANVSEVLENLIADFEKIKTAEKSEEVNYSDKSETSDADSPVEFYSELMNKGFIYDPETREYYMNDYDSSEGDWEDDSESLNEEYRNFYGDYEDMLLHGENEPVNILANYVGGQMNVEGIKAGEQTKLPENVDLNDQNSFVFDEFSKRMLEMEQQSKKSRRKPVYVVLDDADLNSSSEPEQSLFFLPEQTESSYFTESISIDDLISDSSTEVSLQQETEEDFNSFHSVYSEEEESIEDTKTESPDLNASSDNSQTSEEFQVPSISDFESQVLNFPQQGESEVETGDFFVPSENEQLTQPTEKDVVDEDFPDEDRSVYSESDVQQDESETDMSYENLFGFSTHEDPEDIQILPDVDEQDTMPESLTDLTEVDQRLVYLPDSMDYETSEDEESDDVEYNPMIYPQNEGWTYMYSDSPENSLNEDSYGSMYAGAQDFESEESNNYDSYAEYMDQNYRPDSPESMDSQYMSSEYQFAETGEQLSPQDYRLYLDNQNNFQPYDVSDTSYRNEVLTGPEYSPYDVPVDEDLAGNAYYPDIAPLEESSDGSYGYRYVQPNMQQMGNINDYPYNQQFDYVYDGLNSMPYSYENGFEEQSGTVSFEDLAESTEFDENLDESLNLKLSEQPETDEYPSELEAEGKENFVSSSLDAIDETNADVESEDLNVDYVEDEEIRQSDFDGGDIDGSEEIFYVFDDEDLGTMEEADEPNYDSLNLGSLNLGDEKSLDSNYPGNGALNDKYNDLSGESEHDSLKSTRSEKGATGSLKLSESGGNISSSHTSSITSEDNKESSLDSFVSADDINTQGDIFLGRNGKPITGDWSYHTLDKENVKPATLSTVQEQHLSGFKPVKEQSLGRDFVVPNEMFMDNMGFSNSMGFGPYGYGSTNIGQQFGVVDSSNTAAFSKKNGEIANKETDQTRLLKLSSLKDKVLSMKRGKFGMFKKSLKQLK